MEEVKVLIEYQKFIIAKEYKDSLRHLADSTDYAKYLLNELATLRAKHLTTPKEKQDE